VSPLYSLPVLDSYFDSINIDFISPLPIDKEYDMLMTIIDQLSSADICLVPYYAKNIAQEVACLFFDNWYYKNRLHLN